MDTKQCLACRETKPIGDFRKDGRIADGYKTICEACRQQDALLPEGVKRCVRCGVVKEFAEFHVAKGYADGVRSECRDCVSSGAGRVRHKQETLPAGQKRCTQCKEIFPATDEWFKKSKKSKIGLDSWCKSCAATYTRGWYAEKVIADPDYNHRRYIDNRDCVILRSKIWYRDNKEWHHAQGRKWREANKERVTITNKAYYEKNRDVIIARVKQWRIDNPEAYRRYNAEWLENNPSKASMIRKGIDTRRRARLKSLPENFAVQDWVFCLDYWDDRCAVCGYEAESFDADHWIPLKNSECPGTVIENMICLCEHCNTTKQAKHPVDWLVQVYGESAAIEKLAEIEIYFEFVKNRKREE